MRRASEVTVGTMLSALKAFRASSESRHVTRLTARTRTRGSFHDRTITRPFMLSRANSVPGRTSKVRSNVPSKVAALAAVAIRTAAHKRRDRRMGGLLKRSIRESDFRGCSAGHPRAGRPATAAGPHYNARVNPNRATALVLTALAVIAAAVAMVQRGPSPLPATAPEWRFSAARAITTLHEILPDDLPHPIGTPAHNAVRDRIAARFRTFGYPVSMQQTFACNAHATCAPVMNIMARLPGDARADTLAVVAHYDSVAAGPGASDDGIGVASVLEAARALRGRPYRNSVLFLITDAEEAGLLGAEGFVADKDLSRGVAAAINVDNRGTSGRSYLFETSRHNRWLIRTLARALPRPQTTSLYYNIYELLPNDTDLSVFKRGGLAGINFACVGNVTRYHTPLDDLVHVSPSTVQDHGDHLMATIHALANSDLRQTTDDDAVFFDFFSLGIVWWPEGWTRWMAGGALILLFIAAAIRIRDGETTPAGITAGVVSFFLAVIAAAVVGAGAAWLATLRGPAMWAAQPGPVIAAMWLIGMATAMVCARAFYARAGFDGLFIGHGLCWSAIGIGTTIM